MTREEIEALVPGALCACPRCGGENVRKSMWYEVDDDCPMGWQVSIYCECGLRSPTYPMIDGKEQAAEKLRELIGWWNTRTPQGHCCLPDHLCDSCAAAECENRSPGTICVDDKEIPCTTSACNRYKPDQVLVVAVHNSGSGEVAECWTDQLPDKTGYYWYWNKDKLRFRDPEIVQVVSDDSKVGLSVRLFGNIVIRTFHELQTPNARWKFVCGLESYI